ncbi:MAG: TonB-dependent receptor, partial [Rhodanobacter sp.]
MTTNKQLNRLALSAAIAGTLMSGAVMAQDNAPTQGTTTTVPAPATAAPATAAQNNAQQAASAKNAQTLQQVVVTGTANGGLKKIDASYSITTA